MEVTVDIDLEALSILMMDIYRHHLVHGLGYEKNDCDIILRETHQVKGLIYRGTLVFDPKVIKEKNRCLYLFLKGICGFITDEESDELIQITREGMARFPA